MVSAPTTALPATPPQAATANPAPAGDGSPLALLFAALLPAMTPLATEAVMPETSAMPAEGDAGDGGAEAAAQFIDLLLPPAPSAMAVNVPAVEAGTGIDVGAAADAVTGETLPAAPATLLTLPRMPASVTTAGPAASGLPDASPAASPAATVGPDMPNIDGATAEAMPSTEIWRQPEAGADATQARSEVSLPAASGASPLLSPMHAAAATRFAPPPAAAMPAASPLPLDITAPDWTAALGEHIAWSVEQGDGEARVELHPAELGSLTIRISTQGDQARVQIVAAEAAARELLQQSLPQLRELMSAQGLNLARAQVERPASRGPQETGGHAGRAADAAMPSRRRIITQVMLVDAYA